jgi:hypothetical protein
MMDKKLQITDPDTDGDGVTDGQEATNETNQPIESRYGWRWSDGQEATDGTTQLNPNTE